MFQCAFVRQNPLGSPKYWKGSTIKTKAKPIKINIIIYTNCNKGWGMNYLVYLPMYSLEASLKVKVQVHCHGSKAMPPSRSTRVGSYVLDKQRRSANSFPFGLHHQCLPWSTTRVGHRTVVSVAGKAQTIPPYWCN